MAKFIAYTGREKIASLTFEWKISKLMEKIKTTNPGESVKLDNISVGDTNWLFQVFPNGQSAARKETVSVFCNSQNATEKTAKLKITILDTAQENQVYKKRNSTHTFPGASSFPNTINGFGFTKIHTHKEINDNSIGKIHLLITITLLGEEITTRKPTKSNLQDIDLIETQEKLKAMEHFKDGWINDDFSDVQIKCKGEIFYCHKIILAKRSQYFRGMLDSGLQESQMQVINLDYMDVDILKAILKFIYGAEIDNLEVNAVGLVKASNMFLLEDLRAICENYLLVNYMQLENVVDVLVMAEIHNAKILKKGAMEMIVTNSDAIVKQVGWKDKIVDTPKLALEIFEAMASKDDH